MTNYERLVELLLANEVDFVLIGGFAAILHGSSMMTEDLDVCIPFNIKNCENLLKALKNIHPMPRPKRFPLDMTAQQLSKLKNLYLDTDLGPIDFLGSVAELGTFEYLKNHIIEIDLYAHKVKILKIESLIASKKALGRPKDKQVIFQLMAIKDKLEKQ